MTTTATTPVLTTSDDTATRVSVKLDSPSSGRRGSLRAARQRFARGVAALPAGRSAVMPVFAASGRDLGDR